LREIVSGIRREAPGLEVAVRVSIFDVVPYRRDEGTHLGGGFPSGVPEDTSGLLPYRFGFGVDALDPTQPDLTEGRRFLALLQSLGVRLVNLSGGSPYYNPHVQRPALYPPSDGYGPPEDPLAGVVRHLRVARELKREFPGLAVVGSALSYLQDYLPHVAQALVREGWMDFAGLGRMVLTYWDLPADVFEKGALDRKRVCRTFSDCTTAPRNGLPSGCYPLDRFYRERPEAKRLREIKC
jgi:2,4-dienoyl-CoA reductase-like NADH-dependent reductase (Old Yellow Enzyme family)